VPYLPPLEVSPFDAGVLWNIYNFIFDQRAYDTLQVCFVGGTLRRLHVQGVPSRISMLWDNKYYSCC
jgi:hypothetical protein